MVHDQDVVGLALDGAGDALAVLRPEDQGPEDEQVERALQVGGVLAVRALSDSIRPEYAYPPGRMSTQKRRDDDFTREIRAHLQLETARLIDEGMAPDQARAAAPRAFGNVTPRAGTVLRARPPAVARPSPTGRPLRASATSATIPVAALVAVVSLAGEISAPPRSR